MVLKKIHETLKLMYENIALYYNMKMSSEEVTMSKEKRVKERAAWRELQIVIRNYRALGFDYLIKRPSQTRVSFGSTIERDACPMENNKMSTLMRRILCKPFQVTSKSLHVTMKKTTPNTKSTDKKCNAIFESSVSRFTYKTSCSNSKLFSPNDTIRPNEIIPVEIKINYEDMPKFVTPSPGTYNIDFKRKYIYYDSFGGKKIPIPATKTLCMSNPITLCDKCGLNVKGDFWQKLSPLQVYCKDCMNCEMHRAKYCIKKKNVKFNRLAELNSFERVQDCSYYHQHGNTTASVKLIPKRDLIKRFRWENYLSQFHI